MVRLGRKCILLVAVLGIAAAAEAGAQRRAVVVGIEQYLPDLSKGTPAWRGLTNADGARADAEAVAALLTEVYGFDVKLLRDGAASREAILAAIDNHLLPMRGRVQDSAEAVFFFAGHGSQVRNSLSDEGDKMDETLVPADAVTGVPDIRDKELRRRFNRLLDREVKLTVVLDACHSDSAVRGLSAASSPRRIAAMTGDVADGGPAGPLLETRALVLAAAREHELAHPTRAENGTLRGAFTFGLLRALGIAAASESASRVFLRTRSWLAVEGFSQQPDLDGPDDRREAPIFGGRERGSSLPTAAVMKVEADGSVMLMGGWGTGLGEGSELRAVAVGRKERLKIVEAALTRSRARPIPRAGETPNLVAGDLFELERWRLADEPQLRVFLSSIEMTPADLQSLATEVSRLAVAAGASLAADPTVDDPTHWLRWRRGSWVFEGDGASRNLGPAFVPAELAAEIPPGVRLFLEVPPPASLCERLPIGAGRAHDAIAVVDDMADAHYALVGRLRAGALEYAWIRPGVAAGADSPLPAGTAWSPLGAGPGAALKLTHLALDLGRLRGWLTLDAPNSFYFPYRLALREDSTRRLKTGVTVARQADPLEVSLEGGKRYRVLLQGDPAAVAAPIAPKYVYVFLIDSEGKSSLFFPHPDCSLDHHLPPAAGPDGHPREIPICPNRWVGAAPPWGTDTYVLLVTSETLPDPWVLDFESVRDGKSQGTDPLSELLAGRHTLIRGAPGRLVAPEWSISRVAFRVVPPEVQP